MSRMPSQANLRRPACSLIAPQSYADNQNPRVSSVDLQTSVLVGGHDGNIMLTYFDNKRMS